MTANLPFNYMQTTNAPGTFLSTSVGGMQGMYIDAPATRFELRGGILSSSETLPMWGGVGVNVTTTPNTGASPPSSTQGGIVSRATTLTAGATGQLVGFSVFNQAYAMANTPQSPVPLSGSGMQVDYFLLGSNAQMYVNAAPGLLAYAQGVSLGQQVSWDFVGQQLIPYIPAYTGASASSVTYNSTTGILALTFASAPFGASYATAGAYVSVSGITGTGAGVSSLNGNWPIVSTASAGTVINLQAPSGLTASGLSGAAIPSGGGALNVTLIEVIANSMTVSYNSATGFATWNYNGSVALIKI